MKNNKKFSAKLFIISMIVANIISSVVFMNTADAKKAVKKYTKKITVTLTKGQKTKNVSLSGKLKKGDKITTKKISCPDDGITVKRVSSKKVKISYSSKKDSGNGATVSVKLRTKKNGVITLKIKTPKKYTEQKKVTYQSTNNGYTVYFNSASEKSYFDKIIAELSSQLADPDKTIKELTGKSFKASIPFERKQRNILERYFKSHTSYAYKSDGITPDINSKNKTWKDFYNGTFKGVCQDGAKFGADITLSLGFNARIVGSMGVNHSWLVVEAIDADGVRYWEGIYVTSPAYWLTWNQPMTQTEKFGSSPDITYELNITDYSQLIPCTPNTNW